MELRKLVRSNYDGKSPVSIKHENLHSFKKGMINFLMSEKQDEYHIYMAQLSLRYL